MVLCTEAHCTLDITLAFDIGSKAVRCSDCQCAETILGSHLMCQKPECVLWLGSELQGDAFFQELPVQLRGEICMELATDVLHNHAVFCDLVSTIICLYLCHHTASKRSPETPAIHHVSWPWQNMFRRAPWPHAQAIFNAQYNMHGQRGEARRGGQVCVQASGLI